MRETRNFTEGPIFAPLIRFALPVLLALFLQTMYGAVDLGVVGRFDGNLADVYVSAVSTGSQIMQSVTIVITGLAMGLTVTVGRKIGAGQKREAGRIIGSGIWLFGVIAVMLTVVMVFSAPLIAQVMRAPEEAYAQTVIYITICSAGAVFIVAYNLVGSIFRGIGDSKMPLVTVCIACVLNIAGDLLLVAFPTGRCRRGYCHRIRAGCQRAALPADHPPAGAALRVVLTKRVDRLEIIQTVNYAWHVTTDPQGLVKYSPIGIN